MDEGALVPLFLTAATRIATIAVQKRRTAATVLPQTRATPRRARTIPATFSATHASRVCPYSLLILITPHHCYYTLCEWDCIARGPTPPHADVLEARQTPRAARFSHRLPLPGDGLGAVSVPVTVYAVSVSYSGAHCRTDYRAASVV